MSGEGRVKWDNAELERIQQKSIKGLIRMAYDIGNQARRNAPYKTGALANSIRIENNADEVDIIAGGAYAGRNIPYAAIQEFGGYAGRNHSVHIAGKHYMERAKNAIMSGDYLTKYFGDIL